MNYRMPAEWEPHEGTWIVWPHNKEHWPGKFAPTPLNFVEIVHAISDSEKVFICVNDQQMEDEVRKLLSTGGVIREGVEAGTLQSQPAFVRERKVNSIPEKNMKNVSFFHVPTDSSWARDIGPIYVRDEKEKLVILDWVFNAWGDKYKPYDQDDVVPQGIGRIQGYEVDQPGIVLEGGSIEVNGQGLLLTTEQCLLNKNRNPHLNREQIEEYLGRYLGVKKVLWLKEGIVGDDTDGHIDDIARFVAPDTVVCAVETNKDDENYSILQECYNDLKGMTDLDGKSLKVVAIPMPEPVVYEDQRLPASYVNFLITNKSVIVPTFRCSRDQEALDVLRGLFPDRKIVGVDCYDLIWGLGTIHCSTQQMPKV